jgi:predicted nucleotide-binding protein
MKKEKHYPNVRFDAQLFSECEKNLRSMIGKVKVRHSRMIVNTDDAVWSFDTFAEFLAAAGSGESTLSLSSEDWQYDIDVVPAYRGTRVTVKAPTRDEIESIFAQIQSHAERCRVLEPDTESASARIFVGHGQNQQWRDLKDHLHDQHGYDIEAYEIGSRAGHTIRDILEDMLKESSFALLVMTGEDETVDGKILARQNVVHEAGLFQGKLGFSRAIILLEEGTEEFSNIHGLQQIRFSKGKIRESFGDVLAVLKREFGVAR